MQRSFTTTSLELETSYYRMCRWLQACKAPALNFLRLSRLPLRAGDTTACWHAPRRRGEILRRFYSARCYKFQLKKTGSCYCMKLKEDTNNVWSRQGGSFLRWSNLQPACIFVDQSGNPSTRSAILPLPPCFVSTIDMTDHHEHPQHRFDRIVSIAGTR